MKFKLKRKKEKYKIKPFAVTLAYPTAMLDIDDDLKANIRWQLARAFIPEIENHLEVQEKYNPKTQEIEYKGIIKFAVKRNKQEVNK